MDVVGIFRPVTDVDSELDVRNGRRCEERAIDRVEDCETARNVKVRRSPDSFNNIQLAWSAGDRYRVQYITYLLVKDKKPQHAALLLP